MALQFLLHVEQQVGQAVGALQVLTVDLFDAARHADQFRQLLAMTCVVARQQMVDQVVLGLGVPVAHGHRAFLIGSTGMNQ